MFLSKKPFIDLYSSVPVFIPKSKSILPSGTLASLADSAAVN